jgi:cell migration-inducing and hyaluronan-binding protein
MPWSALGFLRNNGFPVSTANFAGDVSFIDAKRYYLEDPRADKDGDKAAVFLDRDGAVTGSAGAFVVPNLPFLLTPACTSRPEWNARVCPERYVTLSVGSETEAVAPLTLTREDAATLTLVGVPDSPTSAHASLLQGRRYTVQFAGAVPQRPRLSLHGTLEGEWVRVTLPYPQAAPRVIRDFDESSPLPAAADLAELEASAGDRYWYDTGTGLLHLKLVTRSGRTSATVEVVSP